MLLAAALFCIISVTGCGGSPGSPSIVTRVQVQICPAALPDLECNEYQIPASSTLRDLIANYGKLELEYQKCYSAYLGFLDTYKGCSNDQSKARRQF